MAFRSIFVEGSFGRDETTAHLDGSMCRGRRADRSSWTLASLSAAKALYSSPIREMALLLSVKDSVPWNVNTAIRWPLHKPLLGKTTTASSIALLEDMWDSISPSSIRCLNGSVSALNDGQEGGIRRDNILHEA